MPVNPELEARRRKWIAAMTDADFQAYIARLRQEGRELSGPTFARWEEEEFAREVVAINAEADQDAA